jgi:hypothetical protein
MFTPGLAIFYLTTILRLSHVSGVQWSRVWRKSRFLEHSIGRWQHAGAWAQERRHSSPSTSPSRRRDNMDRASQVLAQGVPPGVLSIVMNSNWSLGLREPASRNLFRTEEQSNDSMFLLVHRYSAPLWLICFWLICLLY